MSITRNTIDTAIVSNRPSSIPVVSICGIKDKPGYNRPFSQLPMSDVHETLESFLNGLSFNGEVLEPYWVNQVALKPQDLFPMGEVICGVTNGSNEGVILYVMVMDRAGSTQTLFTAKYFESAAMVGLIAGMTSEAFESALYFTADQTPVTQIHSSEVTPYQSALNQQV